MKTLCLIRHAKSSWDYPDLDDFDRPLNKRGRKDAPKMGKILKEKTGAPDLILSSPALRALKTAVIIGKETGYADDIRVNPAIYHSGASGLWKIIRSVPAGIEKLYLFGHNPEFTELANQLTSQVIDNLPTCGIFCVQWNVDSWAGVRKGEGLCLFFDYPKKY